MQLSQPKHAEISSLPRPLLYQPKINGIRATWTGSELQTRNGRTITCLPHITDEIKKAGLAHFSFDGELFAQNIPFQKLNGLIRRKTPCEDHSKIKLHAFDLINNDQQEDRVRELARLTGSLENICFVRTIKGGRAEKHYKTFLDAGYEGLIARKPDAPYGRDVYKIKPVFDSEFLCVSIDTNGATFQTPGGEKFRIEKYNHGIKKGENVTIEYAMLTESGKPVHGRIKAPRYDLDGPDFTYHCDNQESVDKWEQFFDSLFGALKIVLTPIIWFVVFCFTLLGLLLTS